jgi:uncharacterized C2H2 Zn-finger protein
MSVYNILRAKIKCPRCGQVAEQQIDLYFGYRSEMLEFKIGDKYLWCFGKEVHKGGRPENGNIDGEGYVDCEFCKKDYFVKVVVRNDVIENVEFDLMKKGYKS